MLILHVSVHVKPGSVDDFIAATRENARSSIREPGCARFDVCRQLDDATRFVLIEVYRTPDDHAHHRETAHYKKWRETVADMMAEPRRGTKYVNMYPGENGWG